MTRKYGMRLRGFAPLCQPKEGLLAREDDPSGRYHDIIVYDRKLTKKEISDYELDEINPVLMLRKQYGLTQKALADKYGIPKRTIENWEGGVSEPPAYVLKLLERVLSEDFKGTV